MHEPTYNHFDKLLPKYQCRFRNGYNTQQFLIAMTEKMRQSLDKDGPSAALFTNPIKAFDCLPHKLLISKLQTYVTEEIS